MSGSNCCFLTFLQVSQEVGNMVLYSYLSENSPQFAMIHTIKGFSIVNEAEVDVFLKFSCFFCDLADVGSMMSGSSAFSKSSLYRWKFSVHLQLKPRLKDFEYCLASMWNDFNCVVVHGFEHFKCSIVHLSFGSMNHHPHTHTSAYIIFIIYLIIYMYISTL